MKKSKMYLLKLFVILVLSCFTNSNLLYGQNASSSSNQYRLLMLSFRAYWVNESQTRTIHSAGTGGSNPYSYDVWVNEVVPTIDSCVLWIDGLRQVLEGIKIDTNTFGKMLIDERTDTIWFYARKQLSVLYYHPDLLLSKRQVHAIYFYAKPHLMLLGERTKRPVEMNNKEFTVHRNPATVKTSEQWKKLVETWQKKYPNQVVYRNDSYMSIYFTTVSNTQKNQILQQFAKSPYVSFVAVHLFDVLNRREMVLGAKLISMYSDKNGEQITLDAKRLGFKITESNGSKYTLVYIKSNILDIDFLRHYQQLMNATGALLGTFYTTGEVILD